MRLSMREEWGVSCAPNECQYAMLTLQSPEATTTTSTLPCKPVTALDNSECVIYLCLPARSQRRQCLYCDHCHMANHALIHITMQSEKQSHLRLALLSV